MISGIRNMACNFREKVFHTKEKAKLSKSIFERIEKFKTVDLQSSDPSRGRNELSGIRESIDHLRKLTWSPFSSTTRAVSKFNEELANCRDIRPLAFSSDKSEEPERKGGNPVSGLFRKIFNKDAKDKTNDINKEPKFDANADVMDLLEPDSDDDRNP
ncbi:hypothetical protein SCG7086_AK_00200 [Chlamydiales bacterium SCGC AG-110-P3]|nr:hypothetical protein SCG7086_AK_00200 [Chlamydiales bacterium SCGC AG-110-P3]